MMVEGLQPDICNDAFFFFFNPCYARLLCAQFALSGCHCDSLLLGHVGTAGSYTFTQREGRRFSGGGFVCIFSCAFDCAFGRLIISTELFMILTLQISSDSESFSQEQQQRITRHKRTQESHKLCNCNNCTLRCRVNHRPLFLSS